MSMAEKFDLIAKVEEGENPIQLGLAAPAEGSGVTPAQMEMQAAAPVVAKGSLSEAAQNFVPSREDLGTRSTLATHYSSKPWHSVWKQAITFTISQPVGSMIPNSKKICEALILSQVR